jgi:hypothetical protein
MPVRHAIHETVLKYPARVLAGLSVEKAAEFAAIDALPPFDEAGNIAWGFPGRADHRP